MTYRPETLTVHAGQEEPDSATNSRAVPITPAEEGEPIYHAGDRADRLLADHGLGAVIAARLVPVLPFTVVNYAGGLTGVRLRDFVIGSAIGVVPGSLAYAALGASGTDPWRIFVTLAVLVALVVVGGLIRRRVRPAKAATAGSDPGREED